MCDEKTSIMNNEVVIFKDSNGRMQVKPDYVFLKKQGTVKVFAVNTDALLIVSGPAFEVVEKDRCISGRYIEIPAGKRKVIKLKEPDEVSCGEHPYSVYFPENREFIKGNSPPSFVIVDDP